MSPTIPNSLYNLDGVFMPFFLLVSLFGFQSYFTRLDRGKHLLRLTV